MDSNSASLLGILVQIIAGIIFLVSLLGNGFITVVQGHQWLQNRKMLPCDFLLTSLSISRFVTELETSVNYLLDLISSENSYSQAVIDVTWIFFNIASLWSATWLSVFYCAKITNFANCLFLWLKPRINMLAPRLLGMSIIISNIFSLPLVIEYLGDKKWSNLTGNLPGSANQSEVYQNRFRFLLPLQITYSFINASISIIASILLLASLWKHTRNLKKSGFGDKDLRSQVHLNVITPLLFYVFFYLIYFSGVMIQTNYLTKFGRNEQLLIDIMMSTFPSAHSIMLILTNPKLKKMAALILSISDKKLHKEEKRATDMHSLC